MRPDQHPMAETEFKIFRLKPWGSHCSRVKQQGDLVSREAGQCENVCTHTCTHHTAQRCAPIEPREANARRTPLVLSTGSKSWCWKRGAVCICNLKLMHNPWFSSPKALFYVWLEHEGPSWNLILTHRKLSRLSKQASFSFSPVESQ